MRSRGDYGQTGAATGNAVADGDIVQCKILAANRRAYALFLLLYFADAAKAGDDSCKHFIPDGNRKLRLQLSS